MRVGTAVGCCVVCTLHSNQTCHLSSLHRENLLECSSAVSQHVWKAGDPANAQLLFNVLCAAPILNTCTWANTHSSIYMKRGHQKQQKFKDTLLRLATARAASGELCLLLVSTRSRGSIMALHVHQDPSTTGGSVKNARKMPVTAIVHTEYWPTVFWLF